MYSTLLFSLAGLLAVLLLGTIIQVCFRYKVLTLLDALTGCRPSRMPSFLLYVRFLGRGGHQSLVSPRLLQSCPDAKSISTTTFTADLAST